MTRTGPRPRTLLIAAAAAILVGAVGAWLAFALQPGAPAVDAGAPMPTVTATPATAAPGTAAGELADDEALTIVETALAASLSGIGTPEDLDALLQDIAVDDYAAELEAQWLELSSQGWTVTGAPTLVDAEVTSLDLDADQPVAQVTACVDSSDVEMLDAADARIGDPAATTPRALHLFTLVQDDDGAWRISAHSFPNDPTC